MPEVTTPGLFLIPLDTEKPKVKVQAYDIDGVLNDLSAYVENVQVTETATDEIASFSVTFDNAKGRFKGRYAIGCTVIVYLDFDDASTKQIEGKADDIFYNMIGGVHTVVFEGRRAPELVDMKLYLRVDEQTASEAIKSVIDNFNSRFTTAQLTYTNVEDSNVLVSASYYGVSYSTVLKDICNRAGMEWFVDDDADVHAFNKYSKKEDREVLVAGETIYDMPRFGKSIHGHVNKVTASNQDLDGVSVLYEANDYGAQGSLWVKEEAVWDNSSDTYDMVKDSAERELAVKNTIEFNGNFSCKGLPNLTPGYTVQCFVPYTPVDGWYRVKRFTHSYNANGFTTSVEVEEIESGMVAFQKLNKKRLEESQRFQNPNRMVDTVFERFDDETGILSLSGCELVDGYLQLDGSSDSGDCVLKARKTPYNVTSVELRVNGEQLTESQFFVTAFVDGYEQEIVYDDVSFNGDAGTLISLGDNKGTNLQLRLHLRSATGVVPKVFSVALYYKFSVKHKGTPPEGGGGGGYGISTD